MVLLRNGQSGESLLRSSTGNELSLSHKDLSFQDREQARTPSSILSSERRQTVSAGVSGHGVSHAANSLVRRSSSLNLPGSVQPLRCDSKEAVSDVPVKVLPEEVQSQSSGLVPASAIDLRDDPQEATPTSQDVQCSMPDVGSQRSRGSPTVPLHRAQVSVVSDGGSVRDAVKCFEKVAIEQARLRSTWYFKQTFVDSAANGKPPLRVQEGYPVMPVKVVRAFPAPSKCSTSDETAAPSESEGGASLSTTCSGRNSALAALKCSTSDEAAPSESEGGASLSTACCSANDNEHNTRWQCFGEAFAEMRAKLKETQEQRLLEYKMCSNLDDQLAKMQKAIGEKLLPPSDDAFKRVMALLEQMQSKGEPADGEISTSDADRICVDVLGKLLQAMDDDDDLRAVLALWLSAPETSPLHAHHVVSLLTVLFNADAPADGNIGNLDTA